MDIQQSTSVQHIPFLMVDSTDHQTPINGLSPTVLISKNLGTFASPAGAVSGLSLGWYFIAANNIDSNTLGSLIIHASGTGVDLYDGYHTVVGYNPQQDTATSVWGATRTSYQTAGTFGVSSQIIRDGTAQAGAASTITLDSGASATNSYYNGSVLFIYSGTGSNQSPRTISGYVGSSKVATISPNWTTTPDSTSKFIILPQNPALTGNDNKVLVSADAHNAGITISGYVGNTVQTGDNYARIGNAGINLTSIVASSVLGNVGGNILGNLNGNVLGYVNVSGIQYPVASGFANTLLSQSVRCTENTAPSGSLTELILESTNSTVSSTTMHILRSNGTDFSTKTLTLTPGANPIRGIQ